MASTREQSKIDEFPAMQDDENFLEFTNLDGESISDPKDTIRKLNKPMIDASDEINRIKGKDKLTKSDQQKIKILNRLAKMNPEKRIDYQVWDPSARIAMTELWGTRITQEDNTALGKLPEFASLTEEQAQRVLTETPAILQSLIVQNEMGISQGSTLCSVIIQGNKIFTTNIGDSTAFICTVDSNVNVTLTRLNTSIHQPEHGGRLKEFKTNYTLGLSRAIGDQIFEIAGLTHDADVYVNSIDIPENGRAFAINACDGLVNRYWNMSIKQVTQYLQSILASNPEMNSRELSKNLAMEALKRGSNDNITVMITDINPDDITPRFMAVFDGHGGDQVSEVLGKLYKTILLNQILLAKKLDSSHELKKSLGIMLMAIQKGKSILDIRICYEKFNKKIIPLIATDSDITSGADDQQIKYITENIRNFLCLLMDSNFAFLTTSLRWFDEFSSSALTTTTSSSQQQSQAASSTAHSDTSFKKLIDMNILSQAAVRILAIRQKYDTNMPPSYSSKFAAYKASENRKSVIRIIETSLKMGLESYPDKSAAEILDDLLQQLENAKHSIEADKGVSLFKSKLAERVKDAIGDVNVIREQLKTGNTITFNK